MVSTGIAKPKVTNPSSNGYFESVIPNIKIKGEVSTATSSIFVNNTKIRYQAGGETFEFDHPLEEGENLIKIIAVDSKGNESKTALYRVIYTNKAIPEATSENSPAQE